MKTEKPNLTKDEWLALRFVFTDQMQGDVSTAPVILDAAIREAVDNKQLDGLIFQKPAEAYAAFNFLAADHSEATVVKPDLEPSEWQELRALLPANGQSASALLDHTIQTAVTSHQTTGVCFTHPGEAFEGLTYLIANQA